MEGFISSAIFYNYSLNYILTVASFSISASVAPNDASPISCENWANRGSANIGACPISS